METGRVRGSVDIDRGIGRSRLSFSNAINRDRFGLRMRGTWQCLRTQRQAGLWHGGAVGEGMSHYMFAYFRAI